MLGSWPHAGGSDRLRDSEVDIQVVAEPRTAGRVGAGAACPRHEAVFLEGPQCFAQRRTRHTHLFRQLRLRRQLASWPDMTARDPRRDLFPYAEGQSLLQTLPPTMRGPLFVRQIYQRGPRSAPTNLPLRSPAC